MISSIEAPCYRVQGILAKHFQYFFLKTAPERAVVNGTKFLWGAAAGGLPPWKHWELYCRKS